jgi:hypothetical protein
MPEEHMRIVSEDFIPHTIDVAPAMPHAPAGHSHRYFLRAVTFACGPHFKPLVAEGRLGGGAGDPLAQWTLCDDAYVGVWGDGSYRGMLTVAREARGGQDGKTLMRPVMLVFEAASGKGAPAPAAAPPVVAAAVMAAPPAPVPGPARPARCLATPPVLVEVMAAAARPRSAVVSAAVEEAEMAAALRLSLAEAAAAKVAGDAREAAASEVGGSDLYRGHPAGLLHLLACSRR